MNLLTAVVVLFFAGVIGGLMEGNWQPSEQLVRTLILGAFLGLLVGAVAILKSIWRKYIQRSPVQRL